MSLAASEARNTFTYLSPLKSRHKTQDKHNGTSALPTAKLTYVLHTLEQEELFWWSYYFKACIRLVRTTLQFDPNSNQRAERL